VISSDARRVGRSEDRPVLPTSGPGGAVWQHGLSPEGDRQTWEMRTVRKSVKRTPTIPRPAEEILTVSWQHEWQKDRVQK
jgi:hypothetical protein